jgi:hypothetical protein
VLDQGMHDLVGDEFAAAAVRCGLIPVHGEDTAQFITGLRDGAHGGGELLADVLGHGEHIAPARAVGDGEAVLAAGAEDRLLRFGEGAALLALQLRDGLVGLVLPLIAEALVEHQREDVVLVVLPGGLAAQDVGSAPEVRFELALGQAHGR